MVLGNPPTPALVAGSYGVWCQLPPPSVPPPLGTKTLQFVLLQRTSRHLFFASKRYPLSKPFQAWVGARVRARPGPKILPKLLQNPLRTRL